ncbi:MAG: hypothetical protein E7244_27885 [Enterocloster citroniae]|nr:hypothetical protein [Enterocloster citroniae]
MEKKTYYRYEPDDYGTFIIKEHILYGPKRNCFLTKEEATNHFENAQRVALNKYKKIMSGINRLKEEVGDFSYDCDVYVHDDSGLEIKMYIEINVNGYDFRFNQG